MCGDNFSTTQTTTDNSQLDLVYFGSSKLWKPYRTFCFTDAFTGTEQSLAEKGPIFLNFCAFYFETFDEPFTKSLY